MTEYLRRRWTHLSGATKIGLALVCGVVGLAATGLLIARSFGQGTNNREGAWRNEPPADTDLSKWTCVPWGNPLALDTANADACTPNGPNTAWIGSAGKTGGAWTTQQPWAWVASEDGACLMLHLNKTEIPATLVVAIDLADKDETSVRVDLLNQDGQTVASDIVGELVTGTGGDARRCFVLSLATTPTATTLQIRRMQGSATVYATTLFGIKNMGSAPVPTASPVQPSVAPTVQSQAAPPVVSVDELLHQVESSQGTAAELRSIKKGVMAALETDVLPDPTKAGKVPMDQWKRFADALDPDLLPPERTRLSKRLSALFVEDAGTLNGLSAEDAGMLLKAIWRLDGPEGRKAIKTWVSDSTLRKKTTPGMLASLARMAGEPKNVKDWGDTDGTIDAGVWPELEDTWSKAESKGELTFDDMKNVALAYSYVWKTTKAREWGRKAYQKALGTTEAQSRADVTVLEAVSEMMKKTSMIGQNPDPVEYAQVLARLGREGGLDRSGRKLKDLADPIRTKEMTAVLKENVVGPDGRPRLGLCKTLSWAKHNIGELAAWIQETQDLSVQSDNVKSVEWRLVNAYASHLAPKRPEAPRRAAGLQEAKKSATSNEAKLAVLRETLEYFRDEGRYDLGMAFFESAASEVGKDTQNELLELKRLFDADAKDQKLISDRTNLQREWIKKTALLETLEQNLKRAKEAGSPHVAKLTTEVANVRHEVEAK